MNRIALTLLFALTFPIAAHADEASLRAKADELVTVNNTQKTADLVAQNIATQIDQVADRAAGPDATPDQKAKIEEFKRHAAQLIDASLGWAALKPAVIDLYVKTFTEDQLAAILAFYKTPAGAAFIEKMPELNSQFGQLGNTRAAALRDPLQKAYQDLQNSLRPIPSLGTPTSPAPATAPAK